MKQLLSEMDSDELTEWMVYDKHYHLPDSYWQAAMIAKTTADCMAPKTVGSHDIKIFMPSQPIKRQTTEQMRNHLDSLVGITF